MAVMAWGHTPHLLLNGVGRADVDFARNILQNTEQLLENRVYVCVHQDRHDRTDPTMGSLAVQFLHLVVQTTLSLDDGVHTSWQ